ncbi:MAG: hypothetical protein HYT79_06950 [Elusimicrobia bacterium]|nr:hypothetical protein [Elusimicrobiota bacterium]
MAEKIGLPDNQYCLEALGETMIKKIILTAAILLPLRPLSADKNETRGEDYQHLSTRLDSRFQAAPAHDDKKAVIRNVVIGGVARGLTSTALGGWEMGLTGTFPIILPYPALNRTKALVSGAAGALSGGAAVYYGSRTDREHGRTGQGFLLGTLTGGAVGGIGKAMTVGAYEGIAEGRWARSAGYGLRAGTRAFLWKLPLSAVGAAAITASVLTIDRALDFK